MSERVSWAADVVLSMADKLPRYAKDRQPQVEKFITGIARSVKFHIPAESLLGFKMNEDISDLMVYAERLPYPDMVIEVQHPGGHKFLEYVHEYEGGWVCWTFVYLKSGEQPGFDEGWHSAGASGGTQNGQFVVTGDGTLAGHAARVVELCAALACKNVHKKEHEPPVKLNEKRIAKGSLPYDSYYTLEIDGIDRQGAYQGGTGRSPRQHLRRGHIRRLSTCIVWVNSTVVNPGVPGKIVKDYAVAA